MNIIGVHLSSRVISFGVIDEKSRIHVKGSEDIKSLTEFFDNLVQTHEAEKIVVTTFYSGPGIMVNMKQFRIIEMTGVCEQYCRMRNIQFGKVSREELALMMTGSSRSSDTTIQKALMFKLSYGECSLRRRHVGIVLRHHARQISRDPMLHRIGRTL